MERHVVAVQRVALRRCGHWRRECGRSAHHPCRHAARLPGHVRLRRRRQYARHLRHRQVHVPISHWLAYTLGGRVVSVLDSGAEGPGFKSQSRRCRVTVLGKLLTPIVPLFTKQENR